MANWKLLVTDPKRFRFFEPKVVPGESDEAKAIREESTKTRGIIVGIALVALLVGGSFVGCEKYEQMRQDNRQVYVVNP